jgi:uncharacterized damage-inducible protein DinB
MLTRQMEERDFGESELQTIREWFEYNDYVRKKYLKAIESLPEQELAKDRGASFPSLLDIFAHIFFAYRLWLQQMYEGIPLEGADAFGRKCESLEDLKRDEKKMSPYILGFVRNLKPQELSRWIDRLRDGEPFKFNVRNMLWHLVEEELQHRGELNALLWQMDVDPPITGWGTWKKEIGSNAQKAE